LLFCAFSVLSWVFLRIAPDDSVRELEDMSHRSLRKPADKRSGEQWPSFFVCTPQKNRSPIAKILLYVGMHIRAGKVSLSLAPLNSTALLTSRSDIAPEEDGDGRTVTIVKKSL
jgi:hypothetical protein